MSYTMKQTREERKCLECGATFTPRHGNQTICSPKCYRRRRNRQHREAHPAHSPQASTPAVAQLVDVQARLRARDAAYEREYGHPCGRPRGVFYRTAEV